MTTDCGDGNAEEFDFWHTVSNLFLDPEVVFNDTLTDEQRLREVEKVVRRDYELLGQSVPDISNALRQELLSEDVPDQGLSQNIPQL